jgi:hypothetical protein
MSVASEHPRLASTITAALVTLLVAAVLSGVALAGGGQTGRASATALPAAAARIATLQRQLQLANAQDAQLRAQLVAVQGQLVHVRQPAAARRPPRRGRRKR